MNNLQIVIPSYRRMPRQSTLGYLPPSVLSRTWLVIDDEDAKLIPLYDTRDVNILIHPPEIDSIAKKRAFIIRHFGVADRGVEHQRKIVMFDDDLRFSVRVSNLDVRLRQATHVDLEDQLTLLEEQLESYAHCGWSMRQGNNTKREGGWSQNARMCYVLAYDCGLLVTMENRKEIELGRIETREDMDLTLQLLRAGFDNIVNYDIAADQVGGYAAKGGCSSQRTLESSNADAYRLAELHPGLVKVVDKVYEGSLSRKEVIVQWKKAFRRREG